ncbi:hypothetical protein C8F04DRAFT_1247609 [Mycena alexandri]|uniref:NADH-ubiquinone oxidoreductase B15 subunit n=1 Tax=Mycena alexandri TaxID=1745969 RepID=A0AAD6XBQ6_9AGAR|nr:hypothetical protein C8F04DRAFT_1247609 [Mycena alexandri]
MTDGHAHVKVQDAAVERYNLMRENQHKNFRWTNMTLRSTLWGIFLVPIGLYLTMHVNTNAWEWTGKRRGESLAKKS